MGRRGVSAGGGQSSLGYLFGNTEAPAAAQAPTKNEPPVQATTPAAAPQPVVGSTNKPTQAPNPALTTAAGSSTNNYYRADGQNCGNFITDRPSTKVHAVPGGNSSLNYLFGDGSKNVGT